eukprot:scaffold28380_cov154-Skeletonema_menzelii.AAC.2
MRKFDSHEPRMLLESLEEGEVRWKDDLIVGDDGGEGKWYDVGMVIGEIIEDEEDVDVEECSWAWQAYLDEKDE